MPALVARLSLVLVALFFGACRKPANAPAGVAVPGAGGKDAPAVALVPAGEQSRHFTAVSRHLELGGTLYGYVDVEGDVLTVAGELQRVIAELAKTEPAAGVMARQDLTAIATLLGLADVKALGVSSVPDASGFFRNRLFVYTGAGRRGLLAALGGKPAPFKHVVLAPADTAVFGESEMDLGLAYRTIKDVVAAVAGEPAGNQIESALRRAGESVAISLFDLIYGLKGRTAVILRVDPEATLRLPGRNGLMLPAFSVVAVVEGVGQIVEPSLAKAREVRRSEEGRARIYEPVRPVKIEGWRPAIVVEGTTLYVTTSLAFLHECRTQTAGLAQTPEYQRAIAEIGAEGNGLTYLGPRLFERMQEIERLNPDLRPQERSLLNVVVAQLPQSDRPLVAVRTNLDDGILVRSYLNRTMKQDVVALSIYNPVTVGLVAAMAVPLFQQSRAASHEKAVVNHLRQLAAAADQHYLETGTSTATYDELVGPTRAIKAINPVAGENYRALRFQQGQPLRVQLQNGKEIRYPTNQQR